MPTHLTHWGVFETDDDAVATVRPWRGDPEPTGLTDNMSSARHHPVRIDQPHIRKGWLEHGQGAPNRGDEPFVAVSWETALDLLAGELNRVYTDHGATSVYGGSYGWGSAGRFHHPQSQVHRFLNSLGGYVRSVNSYSYGTSAVLLPHIIGDASMVMRKATSFKVIAEHTDLVVAFGGLSPKNSRVAPGGVAKHDFRSWIEAARNRGCRFVSISPIRDDSAREANPEWLAPRPGSDSALLIAIAQVLDADGLVDLDFVRRYTVGYERFVEYLRGTNDRTPKTPEWAESITDIPASGIRELAREMARSRTLITVSWSLQRASHGEQPLWLGVVVAAMLGQIGLPGGGFGHGYGSTADVGRPARASSPPVFPQGQNKVGEFIPVARIADMLLNPGTTFEYNGQTITFPDIRLIYWCGGNPFHHHQDLARLREAFAKPDTVVVHEPFWTATARHADIVLPSTMSIERNDVGSGQNDPILMPMKALSAPYAQARDDYTIFGDLAERLGSADEFTEGRDADEWLRHMYGVWRDRLIEAGNEVPDFAEFWDSEFIEMPVVDPDQVLLSDFRSDPDSFPLSTPSGKIEIFSETIEGFDYHDCPGHPKWLEPAEWLGSAATTKYPLHLIANQPATRLHSQLDFGEHSQKNKIAGREPIRIHPDDAAERDLRDGDVALVFNDRGKCLAGISLSTELRKGVVQLSTGAWYDPDPDDPRMCRHGNPNVLTTDRPTSTLSQGCAGQHALVEIERHNEPVPELTIDSAPAG